MLAEASSQLNQFEWYVVYKKTQSLAEIVDHKDNFVKQLQFISVVFIKRYCCSSIGWFFGWSCRDAS